MLFHHLTAAPYCQVARLRLTLLITEARYLPPVVPIGSRQPIGRWPMIDGRRLVTDDRIRPGVF